LLLRPLIRRAAYLGLATALALFGCATGGRPDGGRDVARGPGDEQDTSGTLLVEPIKPADGSPVTTLPLAIVLRATGETEIPPGSLTFTLYRGADADPEAQLYESGNENLDGITVPRRLLQDEATYAYRVSDRAGRSSEVFRFRLAVDAPVPTLTLPEPGAGTFDRTPRLEVASSASRHEFQLAREEAALQESEVVEGAGSVTLERPLEFGSRYLWRARSVLSSGVRSAWSEPQAFTVSRDFVVEAVTVGFGLPTVSLRPYVAVTRVPGAATYRFELVAGEPALEDPAWASPFLRTQGPEAGFLLSEVDEAATGGDATLSPGASYSLRVELSNDTGDLLGWFGPFVFEGGTLDLPFVPVLTPGERAEFSLTKDAPGVPGGVPADAQGDTGSAPEITRTVALTRPFAMAVTETTNVQFARVMNWALASGRARLEGDRLRAVGSAGVDRGGGAVDEDGAGNAAGGENGETLLFLGELFIGSQLGLEVAAAGDDPPRLRVVEGREAHPVVGVTWHGARAFAEYYGILNGSQDYRLPTEAEWVFAATAGDEGSYPWAGPLSGARANYFRSGDPFEAVTPPYSAQGGPTTPAGYYDGSSRDGYQTLSNASPAGVFDLIGNVWEWCHDWYALGYRPGPEEEGGAAETADTDAADTDAADAADTDPAVLEDPSGPATPEPDEFGVVHRVVRGVGWNTRRDGVTAANRGRFDPGEGSYATGFRLVRDLPQTRTGQ
jgi:formylglycine-generating enzyme required for sulfatase activity